MCELDDLEPFEFYCSRTVKAKKVHICDCCCSPITIGQEYLYCIYKLDGEMSYEKMCPLCCIDMRTFSSAHDNVYFAPSSLEDLVGECLINEEGISKRLKWARIERRIAGRRALAKIVPENTKTDAE